MIRIRSSAVRCSAGSSAVLAPVSVDLGVWTHVACTYDGATHALFINGLVGTSSHATQQRARTIEIVNHVPGAQVVKANILIAAPAGTSASQALEAVKQRLLSMGVEVTWAAMSLIGIEVQAASLRAICCWAEVDYVEVPAP